MAREPLGGWEHGLSPETINNFRQNSPQLIIEDARRFLGLDAAACDKLREILLARGVNKWLKARRDLIALKCELKRGIHGILATGVKGNAAQKGNLKALMQVQGRIRAICHQPRWVEWPPLRTAAKCDDKLVVKGGGS